MYTFNKLYIYIFLIFIYTLHNDEKTISKTNAESYKAIFLKLMHIYKIKSKIT